MPAIVDRDYVLRHGGEIIKTYGLLSYLRALGRGQRGLLGQVTQRFLDSGIPMPGRLGNAYRLSALIELRVARIYRKLSERFSDQPAVRDFFRTLQAEEEEHASLMLLCLYTIDSSADQGFVPCVSDPDIRATLAELRVIDHNLGQLGLDQALHLTERLERSEINVIFEKLLSQASSPRNALFIDQLHQAEGHATAVPKRIRALRDRLRSGSAASPSTDP